MPYSQVSSPEFRVAVGKIFERRRKFKTMTQADLAARAGISQRMIYDYECGNFMPSMTILLKIVYHLEIPISELMVCLKYDAPVRKTDRRTERVFRRKLESGPDLREASEL